MSPAVLCCVDCCLPPVSWLDCNEFNEFKCADEPTDAEADRTDVFRNSSDTAVVEHSANDTKFNKHNVNCINANENKKKNRKETNHKK